MQVEEARRYSRSVGLSWCDSVHGDARQMLGEQLADPQLVRRVDDRPQQADADRLDLLARAAARSRSSTAASSSGLTTSPPASIRSGTSKVSARGT